MVPWQARHVGGFAYVGLDEPEIGDEAARVARLGIPTREVQVGAIG